MSADDIESNRERNRTYLHDDDIISSLCVHWPLNVPETKDDALLTVNIGTCSENIIGRWRQFSLKLSRALVNAVDKLLYQKIKVERCRTI